MHALIVDPNVAFATLLAEELTRLGHEVTQCATGDEAMARARSTAPDLAFLDMALAKPDAVTLARELRGIAPEVRLVVIPLQGEDPACEPDAPTIQGVLPKPFFLPELPNRIQTILKAPLAHAAVAAVSEAPSEGPPVRGGAPVDERPGGDEEAPGAVGQAPGEPLQVPDWVKAIELVIAGEDEWTPSTKGAQAPIVTEQSPEEPATKSAVATISREAFSRNRDRIESLMYDLVADVGAAGALLTGRDGVLVAVGTLSDAEVACISEAVLQGWLTSAKVARILGREQLRFEQSIAGGTYMLYALSVHDAILAVTVGGSTPLGLLRHRARAVGAAIAELCGPVEKSRG
ncbi:MAG: response regulator [Anaerolineae bacterium]